MRHFIGKFSDNIDSITRISKHRLERYGIWVYIFSIGDTEFFILPHEVDIMLYTSTKPFALKTLVKETLTKATIGEDLRISDLQQWYPDAEMAGYTFGITNDETGIFYWHSVNYLTFLRDSITEVLLSVFYCDKASAVVVSSRLCLTGITDTSGRYAFSCAESRMPYTTYFVEKCANRITDPLAKASEYRALKDSLQEASIHNPAADWASGVLIPVYRITNGTTVIVSKVRSYVETSLGILFQTLYKEWRFISWNLPTVYKVDVTRFPVIKFDDSWYVLLRQQLLETNLREVTPLASDDIGSSVSMLHFRTGCIIMFHNNDGYAISGYAGDVYRMKDGEPLAAVSGSVISGEYGVEGGLRVPSGEVIKQNLEAGKAWDGSEISKAVKVEAEVETMPDSGDALPRMSLKQIREMGLDSDYTGPILREPVYSFRH